MHLELSEEQEQLQSSVRAFLAAECPMAAVRDVVEGRREASWLWGRMVELGWPALTVPEEAGGLGLGFVELAVVLTELGRAVTPGPFLPTVTQFAPAIAHAGSPEQRRQFLGAMAAGELTGALAFEGDTTAARDGDGWLLEGAKHFVVGGATADELVVSASVVEGGTGLFVVAAGDVQTTEVPTLDASRPLAHVRLEGVRVAADRALGRPGAPETAEALALALEEATAALAAETVGTCQSVLDMALDHAKTRHQFGVPIGSFQAVKHKLADMLVAVEKARATAWYAALTIAEDDERRTLAVSTAKAAVGDCQRLVAQEGTQIMGGIGYTWEHDMHLYVKRAKSGDALLGTAREHRRRVAALIGL